MHVVDLGGLLYACYCLLILVNLGDFKFEAMVGLRVWECGRRASTSRKIAFSSGIGISTIENQKTKSRNADSIGNQEEMALAGLLPF